MSGSRAALPLVVAAGAFLLVGSFLALKTQQNASVDAVQTTHVVARLPPDERLLQPTCIPDCASGKDLGSPPDAVQHIVDSRPQPAAELSQARPAEEPAAAAALQHGNAADAAAQVRDTHATRPDYCIDMPAKAAPYFLAVHVFNRIYAASKAQRSVLDLMTWLTYQRLAGVEHVYYYDSYVHDEEKLEKALQPAIASGFLTYIDWSGPAKALQPHQDILIEVQVRLGAWLAAGRCSAPPGRPARPRTPRPL
jgi:hypothetical protein